jgi:hypothetical protein
MHDTMGRYRLGEILGVNTTAIVWVSWACFWAVQIGARPDDDVSAQLGVRCKCALNELTDSDYQLQVARNSHIFPELLTTGLSTYPTRVWWVPYSTQLYYPQDFPRHSHLSLPLNG